MTNPLFVIALVPFVPIALFLVILILKRVFFNKNLLELQPKTWIFSDPNLTTAINGLFFLTTKGDKDLEKNAIELLRQGYFEKLAPKNLPYNTPVYFPKFFKKRLYSSVKTQQGTNKVSKKQYDTPFGEVNMAKNADFFNLDLTNRKTEAWIKPKDFWESVKEFLADALFFLVGPSFSRSFTKPYDANFHHFAHCLTNPEIVNLLSSENPSNPKEILNRILQEIEKLEKKRGIRTEFDQYGFFTNKPEMEDLISAIASTPFDPNLPLWNLHVIRNYYHPLSEETIQKIKQVLTVEKLSKLMNYHDVLRYIKSLVIECSETGYFTRLHHSYGDGVAGVKIVLHLSEVPQEEKDRIKAERKKIGLKEDDEAEKWNSKNISLSEKLSIFIKLSRKYTIPFLKSLWKILTAKKDDSNALFMEKPCSDPKMRMSYTDIPISLNELKKIASCWNEKLLTNPEIKKKFSISETPTFSVNDIMIALLSSAMSDYLQKADFEKFKSLQQNKNDKKEMWKNYTKNSVLYNPDKEIKAAVWAIPGGTFIKKIVNTLEKKDLTSNVGCFFLKMPMQPQIPATTSDIEQALKNKNETDKEQERLERFFKCLHEIHMRTKFMKNESCEHIVTNFLTKLFALLPHGLFDIVYDAVAYKTSLSMSSVPGPDYRLIHCGTEFEKLAFTVHPQKLLAIFSCLFSLNRKVYFSVSSLSGHFGGRDVAQEMVKSFQEEANFMMKFFEKFEN